MRTSIGGEPAGDKSLHVADRRQPDQAVRQPPGLVRILRLARRAPAVHGGLDVETVEESAVLDRAPPPERVGLAEPAFLRCRDGDRTVRRGEIEHHAVAVEEGAYRLLALQEVVRSAVPHPVRKHLGVGDDEGVRCGVEELVPALDPEGRMVVVDKPPTDPHRVGEKIGRVECRILRGKDGRYAGGKIDILVVEVHRGTGEETFGPGSRPRPVLRLGRPLIARDGDKAPILGEVIGRFLRQSPDRRRHSPRRGIAEVVVGDDDEVQMRHIARMREVVLRRALAVGCRRVAVNIAPVERIRGFRRATRP